MISFEEDIPRVVPAWAAEGTVRVSEPRKRGVQSSPANKLLLGVVLLLNGGDASCLDPSVPDPVVGTPNGMVVSIKVILFH